MKKALFSLFVIVTLAGCNSTFNIQALNSRSIQQRGENAVEQEMVGGADIKGALK
jgi:hypothetical protein